MVEGNKAEISDEKIASEESIKISKDIEKNKGMAILAYIIFFIPLLAANESEYAMYHANQGLALFLLWISVFIIGTILPVIGWFFILPFGSLIAFVLVIIGIINAANGVKRQLPLIGKLQFLK